jgi:hypothetical protein
MSMSTSLYRVPLSKLERMIADSSLAALNSDRYHLDQGLAYLINDYPELFSYIMQPEGRISQEHEEIDVGYMTPLKLRERLQDLENSPPESISKDIRPTDWDEEYVNKNLKSLRDYLQGAAEQGLGLLIVRSY